jgi:hypothetical protein
MSVTNMQVTENIAEHQWEVIYSGNNHCKKLIHMVLSMHG